ncbi:unnamed protein product, partial [Brenthis ino]
MVVTPVSAAYRTFNRKGSIGCHNDRNLFLRLYHDGLPEQARTYFKWSDVLRPHDETRNDAGARIPLGRTPLPPTSLRTRIKTDLDTKMSLYDNIRWTVHNAAFSLSASLSS